MLYSFNSRSREGSDPRPLWLAPSVRSFNSRSREGSDPELLALEYALSCFNSRSREGSDYNPKDTRGTIAKFQFTLPRGERLPADDSLPRLESFNSRSREGSDSACMPAPEAPILVSIHAPARGATVPPLLAFGFEVVSIHAPARGATRCDRRWEGVKDQVSIHAPARGAT